MVPQNIGPLQNNIMIIRYFIYLGSMLSTYKPSSVIFTCPKAVFSWFKPTFLLNSMDSIAFVAFSSKFSFLNSRTVPLLLSDWISPSLSSFEQSMLLPTTKTFCQLSGNKVISQHIGQRTDCWTHMDYRMDSYIHSYLSFKLFLENIFYLYTMVTEVVGTRQN